MAKQEIDSNELIELIKKFVHVSINSIEGSSIKDYSKKYYNTNIIVALYAPWGGNYKFKNATTFTFLNYKQRVKHGIYPIIHFDRKNPVDNFTIAYGISENTAPEFIWDKSILEKGSPNNKKSLYYTYTLTVNNEQDIDNHKKEIIEIINDMICDFHKQFGHDIPKPEIIFDAKPKVNNNIREKCAMQKEFSKNLILYGPPGTGKTYNTVVKAMSIIHGKDYEYDYEENNYYNKVDKKDTITYEKMLEEYQKELKKESADSSKHIEFVTFHQSYSYEEFVEGIKPYIPQSAWENIDEKYLPEIKYVGKKGIFREICDRASKAAKKEIPFNELWNMFKSTYKEGDKIKGLRSEQIIHYINNGESLQYQTNTQSPPSLPKYKIEEYYKTHKIKPIKSSNDLFDVANKLGEGKGENGVQPLLFAVIHALEQIEKNQLTHKEPYVLIIDEINRGNISKIFGELITLIEEDKRADGDNALTVTLPYSQKPFSIPNNLYIIGTMNTADRSIALLDTALRRRFDFEEMPPDEKLLENKIVNSINLQYVLANINKNIVDEKIGGLDKNYKIGHAFFINIGKGTSKEQESKLKRAFLNKIYPLLEEYFYDDEDKIAKVLNCEDKEGKNLLENIYEGDNWVKILERLSKQKTQDDEE